MLNERGVSTDSLDVFVDLNAFAVQYRYESLYVDEEAIDRAEMVASIDSLIEQVTVAIRA
jgi:hypothetical protein